MPRAFLIDGTAFCYRAFYALRTLNTSDGRPTNAVYGFAMMLQSLRQKERPEYLAVAFDVGKPTFRHQQFEAYKVQRKPMPDALISQLPVVKSLLAAYRIPMFEQAGFEAEDVLATIATRITSVGVEIFLVTGDKDALQLVNSHVKVYNPHKEDTVLDAAAVRARYGVSPERMVELMALMGDEIDNIPGVPGIGEKTAVTLLQRFGSLEQLYQHLEDIDSPARRQSLASHRQQVELARQLAQIHSDVPLEVSLCDLTVQAPNWRALRALFRELEFKTLLKAVDRAAPLADGPPIRAHAVSNAQELEALVTRLGAIPHGQPAAVVGWRLPEEGPLEAMRLAVALDADEAWVVQLDQTLVHSGAGKRFAAWLRDASSAKIGHDVKTLMRWLGWWGVRLQGIAGDTMIAAYLLNPARTSQTLSDLSDEYLGDPLPPLPSLDTVIASLEATDALVPFGHGACAVMRLHQQLVSQLEAQALAALYTTLELPLLSVLAQMEALGIALDLPHLQGLRATMEAQLTQRTQEIYRLAGRTFNLNSPRQLASVLFERLQLPVIKRTKTGASTDSGVLQQLTAHHPIAEQLMQYRELSKLMSTYVDALPQLVDPATGRLHTSFNQAATSTGRLSSSEPNLQNIPIKTELGRAIRKAFIPGIPDGVLLAADYSQIELRILAHLSGDAHLVEAFHQDRDIHRFTASLIYGMPEAEVGLEQRNAMKAINYGILYGMTSHGLSKELGCSGEAAQAFIDAYFQRYPKVREYLDRQIEQAKRQGFVQTLLGRRRYIPEVHSPDLVIRQLGERMAVNAPVQGTAADLIKRAMVELADQLQQRHLHSRMVLQVHDELVLEVPRQEQPVCVELVRRVMEDVIALTVPLTVTMKVGPNWLNLVPIEAA